MQIWSTADTITATKLNKYLYSEQYSNHLGGTDNFLQTANSGGATQSTDTANHKRDLTTGNTLVGYTKYETKKTWTLSSEPIIATIKIQNIINGSRGDRRTYIGLKADFADSGANAAQAGFICDNVGAWSCITADGTNKTTTGVTVVNGDLLTVVATSTTVKFYINNTLVATHTTYIPGSALRVGASVTNTVQDGSGTARQVSVDMLSVKY